MKIAIFSDPHAHNFKKFHTIKNGLNSRLTDIMDTFYTINAYVKANKIDATICAGDMLHTFSFIDNDVLNLLSDALKNWNSPFVYIPGNHDVKSKASYDRTAVGTSSFSNISDNIIYLDNQATTIKNVCIYGLGWRESKDFYNTEFKSADILVGHQLIENSLVPNGLQITKELRDNYNFLIFGDVHSKELVHPNVLIPGAPIQHNFNDEGQERGFWILDTKDYSTEFIPIESPKFITVETVKDIKDKYNFYRVRTPIKSMKGIDSNVIVQQEAKKQKLRTKTLDLGMSEELLIDKYANMQLKDTTVDIKRYIAKGMELIQGCTSIATVPKDYIISEVELCNFMSYRGKHTFKVVEGIYLVEGANGNGKTTVFEAIYWALTGDTTKGVAIGDIPNDTIKKDCFVKLTLINKKDVLRVHRYRKHTEFENTFHYFINDEEVRRESIKETQAELYAYLGTSASFFKNMVYFSQEDFEFFSTMTDAGQKAICKNLLQLDKYEQAEDKTKAAYSIVDNEYQELHNEKTIIDTKQIELDTHIEYLESSAKLWDIEHKQEITDKELSIKDYEHQELEANKKLTLLHDELLVATTTATNYEAEINNTEVDTSTFDNKLGIIEEDVVITTNAMTDIQLNQPLIASTEVFNTNTVKLQQLNIDKASLTTSLNIQNDIRVDLENTLLAVTEATNCITCKQPMPTQAYKASIVVAKKNALEQTNKCEATKTSLEELYTTIYKQTLVVEKAKIDLDALTTRQQSKSKVLTEDLAELNVLKIALTTKRATFITESTSSAKLKLQELKAIRDIKAQEHNNESSLIITSIINPKTLEQSALSTLKATINIHIEQLNISTNKKQCLSDKTIAIEDKYKDLSAKQDILSFWKKGFSNQGLTSYLLDGFAQKFSTRINDVLLNISNGKYTAILSTQKKLATKDEYREKFEFKLFIGDKVRSYKQLSGGQKARVNLATVITLNALVKDYYGLDFQPFGTLILDELFTALDAEGVEAVHNELEQISAGIAVYVITNKQEVKSLFSESIQIDYTEETGTNFTFS